MNTTPRGGLRAALLAVALSVGPSAAHSPIDNTTPAHGTVIAAVPHELVFHFRKPAMLTALQVESEDGAVTPLDFERGAARLQWVVPYALSHTGPHTVVWRALSADGHPVAGQLTFTVTP